MPAGRLIGMPPALVVFVSAMTTKAFPAASDVIDASALEVLAVAGAGTVSVHTGALAPSAW